MKYRYKIKTIAPEIEHQTMDRIMGQVEREFEDALNEMAADGWEFVKIEKVPVLFQKEAGGEEKQLLYQDVAVFRKAEG